MSKESNGEKMTQQQTKLVIDNMDLIDIAINKACKKHKMTPTLCDDAESLLYCVLCECAIRYDENKGVEFRAYALICMRYSISKMLRKECTKGMSYANAQNFKVDFVIDAFHDVINVRDETSTIESICDLYAVLTTEEKYIFQMLCEGYTPAEIAQKLKMSHSSITKKMTKIKKIIIITFK